MPLSYLTVKSYKSEAYLILSKICVIISFILTFSLMYAFRVLGHIESAIERKC